MELGNREQSFDERTAELKRNFSEKLEVLGGESGLSGKDMKDIFDLYLEKMENAFKGGLKEEE